MASGQTGEALQHLNYASSHLMLATLIVPEGAEHTDDRSGAERRSGISSYPGSWNGLGFLLILEKHR